MSCCLFQGKLNANIASSLKLFANILPRLQHSLSVSLVTSLAANNYELQSNLVKCGVLWSLLLFMFEYDYTLDESGVVTDENTNQQVNLIHHHQAAIDIQQFFVPFSSFVENGQQFGQIINFGYCCPSWL